MRSPIRAGLSAALALALIVPFAGSASAHDAASLRAQAIATNRHPAEIDAYMQVDDLSGPDVRIRTKAEAQTRASCNGCEAGAVAVHVVLVDGPVEELLADNKAIAITRGTNSLTTAIAYQIVVAGAGDVDLTRDGRRQLRAVERQIEGLEIGDDLEAATADAVARILEILGTSLEYEEPEGDADVDTFSVGPDIQVYSDIQHG